MPVTAKYATSCSVCTRPIAPGDAIIAVAQRWAHLGCDPAGHGDRFALTAPDAAGSTAAEPRGGRRPVPGGAAGEALVPDGVVEVWTDGACSGNPGPGGWAWATRDGRQGTGGHPSTTNQRMEIQAALEAVRALVTPLIVVSDSTYVVNCFRDGWWRGWLSRGWVNSAKRPVANRDLWEPLITAVRDRGDVTFR
ncbi:MAG TPA: RNase H family protein, partial [Kineosporiaceae bacterium]|nr:RNase H family protein [Kineosporiaceae bacterium]